jgi:5-oxoprolinase (ATP-hydrolysing) subunit C
VTAGYPVIAVATRTSRDMLGQLGPGSTITFRFVTADHARRTYCDQLRALQRLQTRVTAAFEAAGVPSLR